MPGSNAGGAPPFGGNAKPRASWHYCILDVQSSCCDESPDLRRRELHRLASRRSASQSRRISASLLATSRDQQQHKFIRQAAGTIVSGAAILAIGWFFGNSVLRGEADWIGIGFDGLGIYFLGGGLFDLVATFRS